MFDRDVARVLEVLERASRDGCPVARPREEVARAAIRRWKSFANRRIQAADRTARVDDLTKGLIAHMEDHPELVGPLREDYHYLAKLIADELGPEAPQNTRSEILIEGYRPEELFAALGPELEAEVLSGRPLVAQVGTAEILMAFRVEDGVLIAEVAHVDGGGEGVLPVLIHLVVDLARRHHLNRVEWHVLAATCARPNRRLQPILERAGFVVRELLGIGRCYFREDGISP